MTQTLVLIKWMIEVWTVKGITSLCTVTQKIILDITLYIILFYGYLQIWHCYNYKIQNKDIK